MKIGRNDPCPCGTIKENGKPIKYKKCCGSMLKVKKNAAIPKTITISRKDFIGRPFTPCPSCQDQSFGVFLFGSEQNSYDKECYTCGYQQSFELPKIRKKIIYLDQFVIDNIVKSLDKTHPKHGAAIANPFWLEVFKKLEIASSVQMVVCPDSFFHREESVPTNYFESMQKIYEHFSGDVTFYNEDQITEMQICENFKKYLNEEPTSLPSTDPESIVFGELHKWHPRIRISVNQKSTLEEVERIMKEKEETYKSFLAVFERWKTEKTKKFIEWYEEEQKGFAKGTLQGIKNYLKKEMELPAKVAQGYELDLSDIFPPSSFDLLQSMRRIARSSGIQDEKIIFEKIFEYLFSPELEKISIIRIGSLLYAALAEQASRGRLKPPSQGVMNDVKMISSLLPYCDAMFVDKENAGFLNDGRIKPKLGYTTKIFSVQNKEDFLIYLDEIIQSADPLHIDFVQQAYGKDWRQPYMEILKPRTK